MNKTQLVDIIAAKTSHSKTVVSEVLGAFEEAVVGAVKASEEVTLPGFLKFSQQSLSARTGHNPKTGEPVQIPARRAGKVQAMKAFRNCVE